MFFANSSLRARATRYREKNKKMPFQCFLPRGRGSDVLEEVGRDIATVLSSPKSSEKHVGGNLRTLYFPETTEYFQTPEIQRADTFSLEGSILASSSSIFWALLATVVKLSPSTFMAHLLFHFSVGIFVGTMTCMAGIMEPYGPLSAQATLLVRSFLIVTSLFARLLSLRYLTLMNAVTLSNIGPVISLCPECLTGGLKVMTIGRLLPLLGTSVALALTVYSKVVMAEDDKAVADFSVGCALAMTASLSRAVVHQFSAMTDDIPKAVQIFHWSFVALVTSFALVVASGHVDKLFSEPDMGIMVFVSQISFAYVFFRKKAGAMENYSAVNIFIYSCDTLLAVFASNIYLKEVSGPFSYVAAALVLFSVIIVESLRLRTVYRELQSARGHMV